MPDLLFADPDLAALYDLFAPPEGRGDFAFYLPLITEATAVLDVGCGTGALLHRARDRGHLGRLCGLDPAQGMLEQARKQPGIEWVLGDLSSVSWKSEFDLILMSGHAFQVFVGDDELRTALAAIGAALTDDGRFAFETRNPLAREWEQWDKLYSGQVTDSTGRVVRSKCVVEKVEGEIVDFSHTYTSSDWPGPKISHSRLRFLGGDSLSGFIADGGMRIEQQFGDWHYSPLTDTSPEIITIARKAEVDR